MDIDGERLQKAITKRGLMITHVAEEMGRGSTYITDCVRRNQIPLHAYVMLNKMYNITEEEIKPLPVKVAKEVTKQETTGIENKLDRIIELLEILTNTSNDVKGDISKLGNIQMQNLDYVLKIKNELVK